VARRPRFHSLRVAEVERLCDDAVALTFAVPDGLAAEYAFVPGQNLTLRRVMPDGTDERRSYSICAPGGGPLRIGVREVPGGLFSTWLVQTVRPGDEVEVLPPSGAFTLEPSDSGRHVLIAAGSGITPVLSITASVLAREGTSVVLLYGNRRTDTVMFTEELADLKDLHTSRFELVHVLSREPREVELFSGRLDVERLQALLASLVDVGEVDHWWLCGPHGMIVSAREVLDGLGVGAARVHHELFYADEPAPPVVREADLVPEGPVSEVTVILDGRSTTLAMPRGVPILDAVQRIRADLPFACKGGVCGTCRARIIDGETRMRRNFALDPDEVEKGYVLTCQALPLSDQVTVDYDA
jgi:ring-1,2-phenylacetyl-CoA epoxidase subunit PaaE